MKKITLLNPFSVSLGKFPFMEVTKNPTYVLGEFKIYKQFDKHYIHTFKNIVIAERCGANKQPV